MADMTYSEKLRKIDEILNTLERSPLTLEQTLGLYKEAADLIAQCRTYLDEAEGAIKRLEDDGTLSVFDNVKED